MSFYEITCTLYKIFEQKRNRLLKNKVELLKINLSERKWSWMPENEIVCFLFWNWNRYINFVVKLKYHSLIWMIKVQNWLGKTMLTESQNCCHAVVSHWFCLLIISILKFETVKNDSVDLLIGDYNAMFHWWICQYTLSIYLYL